MNNIQILPFSTDIKEKLSKLLAYAIRMSDDITEAVLFGSYARCDYKAGSDVDILFLTKRELDREIRGDISSFFEENNADAIFYVKDNFVVSDCLLSTQIKKDGILLWRK